MRVIIEIDLVLIFEDGLCQQQSNLTNDSVGWVFVQQGDLETESRRERERERERGREREGEREREREREREEERGRESSTQNKKIEVKRH